MNGTDEPTRSSRPRSRRTCPRAEYERRRASRLTRDPDSAAPAHETAWLRGAEGEARLGERLNDDARLVGGVGVLHDLALPGKRANIDHLVIGPAGMTVIDAKAWTGEVWVGRTVIGRGRRGRRTPIDGLQRQIHWVCTVACARMGATTCASRARCALSTTIAGSPAGTASASTGSSWERTAAVSRHAMRPGRYSLAEVADLAGDLARRVRRSPAEAACRPDRTVAHHVVCSHPYTPVHREETTPHADHRKQAPPRRITGNRAFRRSMSPSPWWPSSSPTRWSWGSDTACSALSPRRRRERSLTHRAEFRARAEQRARGQVRGPRVTQSGSKVVLIYRRGKPLPRDA